MRSRQLGLAALFAAGVLLLGNPGWSQEGKGTPTAAKAGPQDKADADQAAKDAAARSAALKADREAVKKMAVDTDKAVTELTKTVADLKSDLASAPTDKTIADLKKTVADLKGELSTVKKDFGKLDASVTGATGDLKTFKTESAAGLAKVEGAAKSIEGMQKSIDAAKTEFDASKKGVDEGLKGVADIKATAEAAKDKAQAGDISRGDTAWMLTASAFVMLMLPGLALFYGGMVRRRNVLGTMMQSIACLSVVGLFWVAFGYGLAFGPSAFSIDIGGVKGGVIGWSWDLFFLQSVGHADVLPGYRIPVYVHVMFQGMFAIITPALISGAVAERIRFWPFCIFTILWISFVYCPLAHMVWAFDWFDMTLPIAKRGGAAIGYLGKLGALDYAGGTVVHIAAGFAGLACCLVLRRRDGYPKTVIHPNSMVLTLIGAGLLWFGWFGFNGGSGLASDGQAGSAFAATQAAAATAGLVWIFIEWVLKGKPTALGLASGVVAGLVAVTPASGYVYVWGGVAIGAAAAIGCYAAVMVKNMLGYDDSLDAFGVHGVGGFIGAVMTGLFCYSAIYSAGGDGFFAMKGQDARVATLEGSGITDVKKEAEKTKAAFEPLKAGYDALVTKGKDKLSDDEKKVFDAGELAEMYAADADKAATGAEAELKTLKETIAKRTADEKDVKGPFSQLVIQLKAATFSAVYALVASLVLVLLVQGITLGNFSTTKKNETVGLDQSEHGETGFDFGLATETTALRGGTEPKAALTPKVKSTRFELAVEGVAHEDIAKLWTGLCQPSDKPTPPDFLAVYPSVTTFSGNHFHCRGADAPAVAARLESLFKKLLPGKPVKVVKL